MLDEVQQLVGACGPEILAVVDQLFVLFFPLLVGDRDGRLLAKRRVGQNVVYPVAGGGQQGMTGTLP